MEYLCVVAIIMPDDVAEEKVKALRALGASVEKVRPASIVDKKQVSFQISIVNTRPFVDYHSVVCRT